MKPPQQAAGALAGIDVERDEQGRPRLGFKPERAALGLALTTGASTKTGQKVFGGFKDLTTKFLTYAKGKTNLSRQEIMDFARRPELKKGEADLLLRKLEEFEPIKSSSFGDTAKIPQRIKQNQEDIESLKLHLKTTSRKDSDVRLEIQGEIDDHIDWNKKAGDFYQKQSSKIPAQEFADSIRRELQGGGSKIVELTKEQLKGKSHRDFPQGSILKIGKYRIHTDGLKTYAEHDNNPMIKLKEFNMPEYIRDIVF